MPEPDVVIKQRHVSRGIGITEGTPRAVRTPRQACRAHTWDLPCPPSGWIVALRRPAGARRGHADHVTRVSGSWRPTTEALQREGEREREEKKAGGRGRRRAQPQRCARRSQGTHTRAGWAAKADIFALLLLRQGTMRHDAGTEKAEIRGPWRAAGAGPAI